MSIVYPLSSRWIGRLSFIRCSDMPRSSRKSVYRLRQHEIDPSLTYEGIASNALPYLSSAVDQPSTSLHLAELVIEHWTIDRAGETISLRDPFRTVDPEEKEYHKGLVHPLKWFYQLVRTNQLSVTYSPDSSKLTVVFSIQPHFSLFWFYVNCQKSDYFHQLFTFDDYQPLVDENNIDAMNMIDFIYREIEGRTMIENQGDEKKKIAVERFLRNEVIRLKEHQIKSIEWMLKRESEGEEEEEASIVYSPLHRCHDLADRSFYVHIISGLVWERFDRTVSPKEHLSLTGGILCDEMGLGKTLCVLLTSLLNPCPLPKTVFDAPSAKKVKADPSIVLPCLCGDLVTDENNAFICHQCSRAVHRKCFLQSSDEELNEYFLCPYCEQRSSTRQALLSTGTTLIIVPASIIDQWIEEIDKHLDCSLRIFMYQGVVNKYPVPSRAFLAEQDFLFCSYENLKKDIHHNELCSKEPYSTRTAQRKYEYLVSPLLQLNFWRLGKSLRFSLSLFRRCSKDSLSLLVLDEAQM